MNQSRGFVLLVMLIFMQIFFLLGLAAMENAFRGAKINADHTRGCTNTPKSDKLITD